MDPGSIVPILALLIGAVIVVVVLLRVMKARAGPDRKPLPTPAPTPMPSATPEEEEYLDSSHILPGGADAAARAAEAMRATKDKGKGR